jgi:hypothetical protein
MEPRRYVLRSMADLLDAVTSANVKRLVADIALVLRTVASAKETDTHLHWKEITWIDDGEVSTYIGFAAPD